MRTAIVGVGNPVLSDDGVGIEVARRVGGRLRHRPDVTALEFCAGGIRLMEAMAGHDRVLLIDSIQTEGGRPGDIYRLDAGDLQETRYAHSNHDSSLAVALEFGRMAGVRLPPRVEIWAIEAGDVTTFGEKLTAPVEEAAERLAARLLRELDEAAGGAAGEAT
jgi:hydrogenase maturation protease